MPSHNKHVYTHLKQTDACFIYKAHQNSIPPDPFTTHFTHFTHLPFTPCIIPSDSWTLTWLTCCLVWSRLCKLEVSAAGPCSGPGSSYCSSASPGRTVWDSQTNGTRSQWKDAVNNCLLWLQADPGQVQITLVYNDYRPIQDSCRPRQIKVVVIRIAVFRM